MNETRAREILIEALTEVAPDVDAATLDAGESLFEQLDIDSMDMLNLVVAVHARTGIEIPERDYPKLATLDGAVAYLVAAAGRG